MNPITYEESRKIITQYVHDWNSGSPRWTLRCQFARPGEIIEFVMTPGMEYLCPSFQFMAAGLEALGNIPGVGVRHLIVILDNDFISPESQLQTFLHEYGHVLYRVNHYADEPTTEWAVRSEISAIIHSLAALDGIGLPELAFREAHLIQSMENQRYQLAIKRLVEAGDPVWDKFAPRD